MFLLIYFITIKYQSKKRWALHPFETKLNNTKVLKRLNDAFHNIFLKCSFMCFALQWTKFMCVIKNHLLQSL